MPCRLPRPWRGARKTTHHDAVEGGPKLAVSPGPKPLQVYGQALGRRAASEVAAELPVEGVSMQVPQAEGGARRGEEEGKDF